MNLPWYAASPGTARYKDAFAGYPAIVVSAGPSLHRNIEMLRQARGKAVIIAVSTVLRPLLRRGIKPDFAVVLDYHPISKKYFEDAPGDEDVRLVVDPKASYDAVDAHRGPKVVIHNDALYRDHRRVRVAQGGRFRRARPSRTARSTSPSTSARTR